MFDCEEEGRSVPMFKEEEEPNHLGAVTLELQLYFKGYSLNRFRIFQADLEGKQLADVGGA